MNKIRLRLLAISSAGADVVFRVLHEYIRASQRKLRDIFSNVDLDSDGELSSAELYECMTKLQLPITEEDALRLVRYLDRNASDTINIVELEEGLREYKRAMLHTMEDAASAQTVSVLPLVQLYDDLSEIFFSHNVFAG
eukprot:CAMPEP_0205918996 /NCGR_PEP_ID=MMETSP1325-20131115/10154_1 /ASSEMBLY_ACC=CAM_ASM_000708 /TAXON_ID=236786 /ORGANISM="Florenciella sp., Strain RCC1007" /LENGTH=138 /DNA_ID=CAMNT_0053286573 /DNA_START=1 /DNA_END=414 /DNA_ORIENTATION=+